MTGSRMLLLVLIAAAVLVMSAGVGAAEVVTITLAGSYDTAGSANGVAMSGDYAYVADDDNGLVIVDISNKAAPTLAGSYDTAGFASGVAVSGDYAYVADWQKGLVIVDISNKAAPTLAGSYNTAGCAHDVAVSGDYAYVADYDGLVIVDITDKSAPTLVGSYDTAGSALGVAVSGDYVYVADDYNGLVILHIDVSSAPTVSTNSPSSIGSTSVTLGGDVSDDGGATVTSRGVAWGTSSNPTSGTPMGSGTGSFSQAISGLNSGTTYYARAYATNSVGTAYGLQVEFTTEEATPEEAPSFTTCPSNVSATTSTNVIYSVSADGNPSPTLTYTFTGATTGSGSGTGSGSFFSVGTTNVEITATNEHGAATCSFSVIVTDDENPAVTELHVGSGQTHSTIQSAVDAAVVGDIIIVHAGSYTENININKRLTLQGAGAGVVTVTAAVSNDHVFEVTADSVSISGFTVTGATASSKAGIYLGSVGQCSIVDNIASNNFYGIYLDSSSSNTLTSNTVNSNSEYGIYLESSSSNQIYNNEFNNANNARDNGNNVWNTTVTGGTNLIYGRYLGGNYWLDYGGTDSDYDELGDTLLPYTSSGSITTGGDYHPLTPYILYVIWI